MTLRPALFCAYPRLRWAFRTILVISAGLAGLFGGEIIHGADWLF